MGSAQGQSALSRQRSGVLHPSWSRMKAPPMSFNLCSAEH
ncbi:unnamed protein product [Staurois parvus]|uniref:Uncharacterized protein n=1 Tax=Staurois parvus TaxID=386267 RepID=A0ABN9B024_9NEOB|nr:unnamed protein product [Staurois parvus]